MLVCVCVCVLSVCEKNPCTLCWVKRKLSKRRLHQPIKRVRGGREWEKGEGGEKGEGMEGLKGGRGNGRGVSTI